MGGQAKPRDVGPSDGGRGDADWGQTAMSDAARSPVLVLGSRRNAKSCFPGTIGILGIPE
jgi:hypothetical protein